MKKVLLLAIALTGIISNGAIAQEAVKKNVEKEVKIEVKNGVKTLTIKSSSGGYPTEEIYTGEAAEKKMAELEDENGGKETKMKEIESGQKVSKKKKIIKVEKKVIEKSVN